MEKRVLPSVALEASISALLAEVGDPKHLTEVGRLGMRLVLQRAVEEEVAAFRARSRYERTSEPRASKNGNRLRRVQTAKGELGIEMPQLRRCVEKLACR